MTAEICMFNKFGFCKKGESCRKIHLVEICLKDICDARKCDKRHPRPCKFFNQKGFCRFEIKCKFSHKPNKTIQEQNSKIDALEKKTEMLLRMIEEQKATIQSLEAKVEGKNVEVVDESIDETEDEEEEESREIVEERSLPFMMKQWKLLGNLKSNIENLRNSRNEKDFRGQLYSFNCKIQKERKLTKGKMLTTSEMPMERINEFLDDDKQKCNKEEVMNLINSIRKSFAGCMLVNFKDKIDVRDFCFL